MIYLCFLGPPGAGKSTTAQLFGRNHGYVYYEADCFMSQVNPFMDLNADDPSLAQVSQTPLSVSPQCKISKILFRGYGRNPVIYGCYFGRIDDLINSL